jgi:hypothetical protein
MALWWSRSNWGDLLVLASPLGLKHYRDRSQDIAVIVDERDMAWMRPDISVYTGLNTSEVGITATLIVAIPGAVVIARANLLDCCAKETVG